MSKIKIQQKFHQLTYRLKHDFLTIENVVLVLGIFLCLTWTYQSICSMSRSWELTETLADGKKSLKLLTLEVESLELENAYYKTEEYQELAARKFLNKQLPGEHLVYLPENSTDAKTKHQSVAAEPVEKSRTNPEKWFLFLNLMQ